MEKDKSYLVNGVMLSFAFIYIALLLALGVTLIMIGRLGSALIFIILALPFFIVVHRYGSVVSIGKDGIKLSFLHHVYRHFTWEEIEEIDVAGVKVLNRLNPNKCGTIYFIFSKEALDDEKRFDMMLKWPPKDKIYLKFNKDKLMDLQWFYSKPVERYNIGMLDI